MPDAIRQVIERFPELADAIIRLAGESEAFLSICDDYALGVATLHRFEAEIGINHDRVTEYRALVHDLEQEIERTLAADGAANRGQQGGAA